MGDYSQKLHDIATRRQDIKREIAHHPQPTPTLDHSYYEWDSTRPKPQGSHLPLISLTQTGSSCKHYQPSVPSERIILS